VMAKGNENTVAPKRLIHRTLNLQASEYEKQLSRALIGILGRGIHDLADIVAALNQSQVQPASGGSWTERIFESEMERLGAYPNSIGAPLGAHPPGIVPRGASTDVGPSSPK
jgi:hypothetical protein